MKTKKCGKCFAKGNFSQGFFPERQKASAGCGEGAQPFIPFKKNTRALSRGKPIWHKMFHYFKFNQEEFMQHYHARSNAESSFGALKAKFNDSLKSKTNTAQVNELLLKVLCFNIAQVIHETNELGK